MDTAIYVIVLVLNLAAIGMIFTLLMKWKRPDIKLKQHLIPTILLSAADIVILATGQFYAPIFLPSLGVVLLGINLKKDDWPDSPKFAEYHKMYILVLAFSLLPGIALLGITYPLSLVGIVLGVFVDLVDYVLMCMLALIPLLVFMKSDPLDRKDRRNMERVVGSGIGLGGAILGLVLVFLLNDPPFLGVAEGLAILFSIVGVVAALLLFLPFFLHEK